MATHEQRISRLEGAFEQLSVRLDEMNSRLNEMNSRINTLTHLMGGAWVTIMAAIITLFFAM